MKRPGYPANFEVRCASCNAYYPIETVKVRDNGYYCQKCYQQLRKEPYGPMDRRITCSVCNKALAPTDVRVQVGETTFCDQCYEKSPGVPENPAVSEYYRSMSPRRGPTALRSADKVIECKYCGLVITLDRLVEDESGKFHCPKCDTCLDIRRVKLEISGDVDFTGMAQMFRRLGDPCRVKIIESLSNNELSVSAFVEITGAQYSLTSYHLKVLKDLGLVKSYKQSNFVIYSLTENGEAAHEFIKRCKRQN